MKRMILAAVAALVMAAGVYADDKTDEKKPGQRPGAGQRPGGGGRGAGGGGMMIGRMLEKADADKDGKISLDEFKKALENAPGGRFKDNPQMADRMFKRLDTNGDGFISQDEIKKAGENMRGRAGQRGQRPGG